MYQLRNLALLAGVLCLGLSPALAMSHEEREGEHGEPMGPPPAPESLRPIFQEAIDSGDLSEHAESLLLYLNLPREDREGVAPPPPPEEDEGENVKEELMRLFKDILEEEDRNRAQQITHILAAIRNPDQITRMIDPDGQQIPIEHSYLKHTLWVQCIGAWLEATYQNHLLQHSQDHSCADAHTA